MVDRSKLYETDRRTKEQVFKVLKKQILEGTLRDGDMLASEEMLAVSLKADLITVQEVLEELLTWDLLEKTPEGYIVRTTDFEAATASTPPKAYQGADLQAVMQFRRAIETETVAIAAECATKEDIAALHAAAMDMITAVNWKERMMADRDFHYRIAKITRNPLILRSYDAVWDVMRVNMIETAGKTGNDMDIYYHSRIIAAMAAHDGAEASRMMREHLTGSLAAANLHLHEREHAAGTGGDNPAQA